MKKLILAVPKGSLYAATIALFQRIGIRLTFDGRSVIGQIDGTEWFQTAYLDRPQDMPQAVAAGTYDLAICGWDCVVESGLETAVKIIAKLAYSKATRQNVRYVVYGRQNNFVDTESIRVASEYPAICRTVFPKATIIFSRGCTETKVKNGSCDYGFDVCETGASIQANGLTVIKTIFESPTVLIAREATPAIKLFGDILRGALEAEKNKLIKFDCPDANKERLLSLLPAIEAPTVSRLSNGNCAIETVVGQNQVFDLVARLKQAGARGILVQDFNILI